MAPFQLLVVGDPQLAHLRVLQSLPKETEVHFGLTAEQLQAFAPEADAVLMTNPRKEVLAALWPDLKKVRWVHSLAAGVEGLLFPELVKSEVPLTNARGVFKESLGEFAVASVLFFAKDLRRMVRNQQAGVWEPFDVEEISRQSIGIVGYGEIGQAAAKRAHALGMKVHALRRRPERSAGDPYLTKAYSIENRLQMLAEVDYLVLSAPLTPETRGLIGHAEIASLKSNAVVINVGRGPVVDEVALIAALQEGRIRGAALDVFDEEPLPATHPFWRMENVLLSPHCADHTRTWLGEAVEFFLSNLRRFQAGEDLHNKVDKKAGY